MLAPQPFTLYVKNPASTGKPEAGPLPTSTTSSTTTGGEDGALAKLTPVHAGWHCAAPQPAMGYAETPPMNAGSGEPLLLASTNPPAIAGAPSVPMSPVKYVRNGLQTETPQPPAAKAIRWKSV